MRRLSCNLRPPSLPIKTNIYIDGYNLYCDAIRGHCEQVVICSNDSDVEPVLKLLALDAPTVTIGLVLPLREPGQDAQRFSNKRLLGKAHWVRHYIRDEELAKSQLPQHVPTNKKLASKPAHW